MPLFILPLSGDQRLSQLSAPRLQPGLPGFMTETAQLKYALQGRVLGQIVDEALVLFLGLLRQFVRGGPLYNPQLR